MDKKVILNNFIANHKIYSVSKNNCLCYGFKLFSMSLLYWFLSSPAFAEDLQNLPLNTTANTLITSHALGNVRGAISINIAAGNSNAQLNARALAIAPHGKSTTRINALQFVQENSVGGILNATARIKDHAFSNAIGLISINQTSGTGNIQENNMAINFGISGVTLNENALAKASATPDSFDESVITPQGDRAVSISDTAFKQARGVVQVNQVAGTGNISANRFALQFSTSANHSQ